MSDLCPHATTRLLTERVALREFTRGDVDDILALDGDPQVMRYIGDGSTATRALAQAGIERAALNASVFGKPIYDALGYTVVTDPMMRIRF